MVIQRWQSVLLLLAAVAMIVLNFLPMATLTPAQGAPTPYFTTDVPILLIIDSLISILLILGIFMFKNLKLQMHVTLLTVVLMCVMAVVGAFVLYRNNALEYVEWTGAVLLLLCAVILALVARQRMNHDYRLLRSVDRLR